MSQLVALPVSWPLNTVQHSDWVHGSAQHCLDEAGRYGMPEGQGYSVSCPGHQTQGWLGSDERRNPVPSHHRGSRREQDVGKPFAEQAVRRATESSSRAAQRPQYDHHPQSRCPESRSGTRRVRSRLCSPSGGRAGLDLTADRPYECRHLPRNRGGHHSLALAGRHLPAIASAQPNLRLLGDRPHGLRQLLLALLQQSAHPGR